MKTKTTKKISTTTKVAPSPRSKAGKIARLKRVAAARSWHHHKRVKKLAIQHLLMVIFGVFVLGSASGIAFAISIQLIPPPGGQDYKATDEVLRQYAMQVKDQPGAPDQVGKASWYAIGLRAPDAITCASTKFPRGTHLKVKNLRNGKEVTCLVNDYGPQPQTGKVIDLSRGSFRQIADLSSGVAPVEIRVLR